MSDHFHTGVDAFLVIGVMAWLFLNLLRIAAARLAQVSNGALASFGTALGATV